MKNMKPEEKRERGSNMKERKMGNEKLRNIFRKRGRTKILFIVVTL